jgi:scyllo-inositol 2-dehydrogenase (NADP+)
VTRAHGSRIPVACFGAGWVTTNRHIPALRAHGGFDVRCLADRRGERAREAAERLAVPHHEQAAGVDELSIRDEIRAVTCGTAPFAHERVIRSALEAGKHVLTEKPFTMTLQEGEELVALARERSLVLAVVHNFQFARSVLQLRRWLDEGRLGTVRAVWAVQFSNPARRLPAWFDELPGGLFYDESPHLIYTARALAGGDLEPVSVTVHPSTRGLTNTPAQVDAQMRAGQVPVSIQMNFEAPVSEWHVAVLGERGMGVVDLFRDIAVFTPGDGDHHARQVIRTSASASWHHWLGYLRSGPRHVRGKLRYGNDEVFSRFHAAIGSGEPPQGIGADDALAVLRVQHWILEARGRILV